MRGLLVTIGVLTGVLGGRAASDGFDHQTHDRALTASRGTQLACTNCHAITNRLVRGRPDHAGCFIAGCHVFAPGASDRALCTACHTAPRATAQTVRRQLIDRRGDRLVFGHNAHAAVPCAACHDRATRSPPHRRCVSCHDGKPAALGGGPPIAECRSCHALAAVTPPRMAPARVAVTTAFSHARHAPRAECAACHPDATTASAELARPTAQSCAAARCHDGKRAFGIIERCRPCHQDAGGLSTARPLARYQHASPPHAAAAPCTSCHAVAANGRVASVGHRACSGCHAADFGLAAPTICGACHTATEPWRALIADQLPPDRSEFGTTLEHVKHSGECVTCHALATASRQLRTLRGHDGCAAASCHGKAVAPAMTDCETCHKLGLEHARERARGEALWSVRRRFVHGPHRATACTACHSDVTAPTVLSLATPTKQTCIGCHDGSTAFKATGTGCRRCHSR